MDCFSFLRHAAGLTGSFTLSLKIKTLFFTSVVQILLRAFDKMIIDSHLFVWPGD